MSRRPSATTPSSNPRSAAYRSSPSPLSQHITSPQRIPNLSTSVPRPQVQLGLDEESVLRSHWSDWGSRNSKTQGRVRTLSGGWKKIIGKSARKSNDQDLSSSSLSTSLLPTETTPTRKSSLSNSFSRPVTEFFPNFLKVSTYTSPRPHSRSADEFHGSGCSPLFFSDKGAKQRRLVHRSVTPGEIVVQRTATERPISRETRDRTSQDASPSPQTEYSLAQKLQMLDKLPDSRYPSPTPFGSYGPPTPHRPKQTRRHSQPTSFPAPHGTTATTVKLVSQSDCQPGSGGGDVFGTPLAKTSKMKRHKTEKVMRRDRAKSEITVFEKPAAVEELGEAKQLRYASVGQGDQRRPGRSSSQSQNVQHHPQSTRRSSRSNTDHPDLRFQRDNHGHSTHHSISNPEDRYTRQNKPFDGETSASRASTHQGRPATSDSTRSHRTQGSLDRAEARQIIERMTSTSRRFKVMNPDPPSPTISSSTKRSNMVKHQDAHVRRSPVRVSLYGGLAPDGESPGFTGRGQSMVVEQSSPPKKQYSTPSRNQQYSPFRKATQSSRNEKAGTPPSRTRSTRQQSIDTSAHSRAPSLPNIVRQDSGDSFRGLPYLDSPPPKRSQTLRFPPRASPISKSIYRDPRFSAEIDVVTREREREEGEEVLMNSERESSEYDTSFGSMDGGRRGKTGSALGRNEMTPKRLSSVTDMYLETLYGEDMNGEQDTGSTSLFGSNGEGKREGRRDSKVSCTRKSSRKSRVVV